MDELDKLRIEIDSIDRDILDAFERRIAVSRRIGNAKRANGIEVFDAAREEAKLKQIREAAGFESAPYAEDLFRNLMGYAKIHQNKPAFGVLGKSLPHTYSPMIHNIFDPSYTYSVIERNEDEIDELFGSGVFKGFNVTIPYKREAYARCDVVDDAAKDTGSVNTVVFGDDGKTYGYNTDCFGIDAAGKTVLVLGTGGAAASVLFSLQQLGASRIVQCGRTSEVNYENVYELAKDAEIIVNCTPAGMYPDVNKRLIDLSRFEKAEACVDLIYNPSRTRFLQDAEELGIKTAGGLSMLVAQAYKASRYFAGDKDGAENIGAEAGKLIESVISRLELSMRNITLIGMPGSGKTTLAKRLALLTGRKMVDLDYAYRDKFGMTSAEAISGLGEDAFRENEMEVAAEVLPSSGLIISCGGGIVTREQNKFYVRCNSNVIYLERPLTTLSDHNRPVSIQHGVEKLYSQRKEAYETWCDYKLHLERFEDKASYSDGAGIAAMELIEKMKDGLS